MKRSDFIKSLALGSVALTGVGNWMKAETPHITNKEEINHTNQKL
ncbi:hypothetical protein [Riemerella columbina]|nr:hypothetical protein [Riemerella columbina]